MKAGKGDCIDGYREQVVTGNAGYKKFSERRDEASRQVNEVRTELLAARGFVDAGSCYSLGIIGHSLRNAASVLTNLDCDTIIEIISELQTDYQYFPILNPDELMAFSRELSQLLHLPDGPRFEQPCSEAETTSLDKDRREQHVDAADRYLVEAEEYVELMRAEISRQKEKGISFNHRKIEGEASRILEKYERHLSLENMSLKFLVCKKEEPCREDWLMVRLVLLLAAGIHGIVRLALDDRGECFLGMTDELMVDLISGLDEGASKEKGSVLAQYLADIEEINCGKPLSGDKRGG